MVRVCSSRLLLDPEQGLAGVEPPAALEGGIHPYDSSADLRSDIDLRAEPDRSGAEDGGRPGTGGDRGGRHEGKLGWRFETLRFRRQRHQEGRHRHGAADNRQGYHQTPDPAHGPTPLPSTRRPGRGTAPGGQPQPRPPPTRCRAVAAVDCTGTRRRNPASRCPAANPVHSALRASIVQPKSGSNAARQAAKYTKSPSAQDRALAPATIGIAAAHGRARAAAATRRDDSSSGPPELLPAARVVAARRIA